MPSSNNATRPAQQRRIAGAPSTTAAGRVTGRRAAAHTTEEASTSAVQSVSHTSAQTASTASIRSRRGSNRSGQSTWQAASRSAAAGRQASVASAAADLPAPREAGKSKGRLANLPKAPTRVQPARVAKQNSWKF